MNNIRSDPCPFANRFARLKPRACDSDMAKFWFWPADGWMALVWQTVAPEESVMGPCIGLLQRFFRGAFASFIWRKKKEELFYSNSPLVIDTSSLVLVTTIKTVHCLHVSFSLSTCSHHVYCVVFSLGWVVMWICFSWYSCIVVLTVLFMFLTYWVFFFFWERFWLPWARWSGSFCDAVRLMSRWPSFCPLQKCLGMN